MSEGKYKIKHGANAIGTKHHVKMWLHGNVFSITYEVKAIQGLATFAPQHDEPVIFLKIAQRTGSPAPPYITVTLSMLADDSAPATMEDFFYDEVKHAETNAS